MQLLTTPEIIYTNARILHLSHIYDIEYIATTFTRIHKIHALRNTAPADALLDTATYYMKNIILLQAFPDGNHRTSLECVRLFYHKNNIDFKWNPEYVEKYQRKIYRLRYKIYHTYEELSANVLTEPRNELWDYCRDCIKMNLSNPD